MVNKDEALASCNEQSRERDRQVNIYCKGLKAEIEVIRTVKGKSEVYGCTCTRAVEGV